MNTAMEDKQVQAVFPHARTPERWLLVGPDAAWCERALAMLNQRADSLPEPSFLRWRLAHGLIRVVPLAAVNAELTRVLSDPQGSAIKYNATWVWAAVTADDWYERTRECLDLQKPSARGLNVKLLPSDDSDEALDAMEVFVRDADAPDTLPRLTWLMNDRPMPVPREWLCLAPMSELNEAQNAALASEGLRCYEAWAEDVLASSDPDELRALWGPYPDDEVHGDEDDTEIDNVVDMDAIREQRVKLVPPPLKLDSPTNEGLTPLTSFRMAAASESGGVPDMPVCTWDWSKTSAVSRGAIELQAFCLRPDASVKNLPRVEFVARWDNSKKMLGKAEDLCLVVTLSKRKPVLIKGESDKDDPMQVRFKWPANRWPQDMPTHPLATKTWLREHLSKARVSLQ